jgi:hypothetical protein
LTHCEQSSLVQPHTAQPSHDGLIFRSSPTRLARPGEGLRFVGRWKVQHAPAALERCAIFLEVAPHPRHRLVSPAPVDLDRDPERWEREIETPLAPGETRIRSQARSGAVGRGLQDAPGALERAFGGRSSGAGSNPAARIAASSSGESGNP